MKRRYAGVLYSGDRKTGVKRVKKIDIIVNDFISNHPACNVINLGCGFDTRFWRIENKKCAYVELDLPEVIELKKEILEESHYELIGFSVLDTSWIDKVTSNGNSNFLIIAEGLFMYLPEQDLASLLRAIAQKFNHSEIVFDMAYEKYTKGFWKRLIKWSFRTFMGLDVSFVFGKKPEYIESYANGLKVIAVEKGPVGPIVTLSINAA